MNDFLNKSIPIMDGILIFFDWTQVSRAIGEH